MGKAIRKRDVEREALARIEEAARTKKEFRDVVRWWNRLDANRERKERYHEHLYYENGLESEDLNPELDSPRLGCDDDFIDLLSMCPCKMHNIIEDNDIAQLVQKATDKQKAVFFPRVLLCCSNQRIACCHDMTDRNVRKLIDLMLENIRKALVEILQKRVESKLPLTYAQKQFLSEYRPKDKKKNKK